MDKKLKEIGPNIFFRTPVLFSYLYGSVASGMAHKYSDLDVAVFVDGKELNDGLDLELSLSLKIDEALEHCVASEVRIINYLPLVVVGRILTEGVLIYSRSEEKRVEFETRLRSAYFDFLPSIHLHRTNYINHLIEVQ